MTDLANQVIAALEMASHPDSSVRSQGEVQLVQLQQDPARYFEASLGVVVSPSATPAQRRMVGLQLKHLMKRVPAVAQQETALQSICTQVVADPQKEVRKVGCNIISLAVREGVWQVGQVLPLLLGTLQQRGSDVNVVHGVVKAFAEVTMDAIDKLDAQRATDGVVSTAVECLSNSFGNTEDAEEIKKDALEIVSVVLENAGLAIENPSQSYSYYVMQQYVLRVIEVCFSNLQNSNSKTVTEQCVRVLTLSLVFHDTISDELFNQIARGMIHIVASSEDRSGRDEELRMAATDFFAGILLIPRFYELAQPIIPDVIPYLVKAMVLSDIEIGTLQANQEDWNVPDREEDIRPRHYGAKQQQLHADDDDDDDSEEVESNNLRTTSGAVLDVIASAYGETVVYPVLEVVDKMMQQGNSWRELEAAILAIGAIADGCIDALAPHLPGITDRILSVMEDPNSHFIVVSMCLWTCSKLSSYLLTDQAKTQRFILKGIVAKMQSPSKYTQEYATTALQTLVETNQEVGANLAPYVPSIVEVVSMCLRGYQLKNKVLLLDVLQEVCLTFAEEIKMNTETIQTLLNALGELWGSTKDDSMFIFPLFSCMSCVCSVMGSHMESMQEMIFTRALSVLESNLIARRDAFAHQLDPPEDEFITTSCYLLSGVFEAVGSSMEAVVQNHPSFLTMLMYMLVDPESAEIRSSGFGLASEMCLSTPAVIQQQLPTFMDAVLQNLSAFNEENYGVVGNVAWALCQLIRNQLDMNQLPTFQSIPQGIQAFQGFVDIFVSNRVRADMRNMAENICFFIGLAVYHIGPEITVQAQRPVSVFAVRFLEYMRNIKDMEGREECVGGFLLLIQQDLACLAQHLVLFFDLACTLTTAGHETKRTVKELLLAVKQQQPQTWKKLAHYNDSGRKKLYEAYGVN